MSLFMEAKLKQDKPDILEVRLEITQSCNLSCNYCIAESSKQCLSLDIIPDIINLITDGIIEHSYRNIVLTISGGESLMEIDKIGKIALNIHHEITKLFVVDFSLKILTNGLLLRDSLIIKKISILNKLFNTELIISLHDANCFRIFKYYKQILDGHNIKYYTRKPISSLLDYRDTLAYQVSFDYKIDDIFPVFNSYEMIKELKESGKSLSSWEKPNFIVNNDEMSADTLWKYTNFNFKGFTCGAGKHLVGIDAYGKVYPCSEYLHNKVRNENSMVDIKDFKLKETICEQTECWCFTTYRRGIINEPTKH